MGRAHPVNAVEGSLWGRDPALISHDDRSTRPELRCWNTEGVASRKASEGEAGRPVGAVVCVCMFVVQSSPRTLVPRGSHPILLHSSLPRSAIHTRPSGDGPCAPRVIHDPGAAPQPLACGPGLQTAAPNIRPTRAESSIARAPQKVTRAAPRQRTAPPTCAAAIPRTARSTSVLPVTTCPAHA